VLAAGAVVLGLVGPGATALLPPRAGMAPRTARRRSRLPQLPLPRIPGEPSGATRRPWRANRSPRSRPPLSRRSRTRRSFASRPMRTATPPTRHTSSRRMERLRPSTSTSSSRSSASRVA